MGKYGNGIKVSDGNGMVMGMKSLKWEGIGTKNLFPHTSSVRVTYHYRGRLLEKTPGSLDWPPVRNLFFLRR